MQRYSRLASTTIPIAVVAQSAAALPLLVAMKSDFHETYDGRLLVGITRPTRREAKEEAYRTYMHDTVDAAYTLLGILMGSAHARPPPAYTSMGLAGGHWNGHGIMRPCLHWDGYRFVRRMRKPKHFKYEQTCEIGFRIVGLRTWAPRLGVELELDRQVRAPDKQNTSKSKHHQPPCHESCGTAHHQRHCR